MNPFQMTLDLIKEYGLKAIFAIPLTILIIHNIPHWINRNAEAIAVFFFCLGIFIVIERIIKKFKKNRSEIKSRNNESETIKQEQEKEIELINQRVLNLTSDETALLLSIYNKSNHCTIENFSPNDAKYNFYIVLSNSGLLEMETIMSINPLHPYGTVKISMNQNVVNVLDKINNQKSN